MDEESKKFWEDVQSIRDRLSGDMLNTKQALLMLFDLVIDANNKIQQELESE